MFEYKNTSEFPYRNKSKGKFLPFCKECNKQRNKDYVCKKIEADTKSCNKCGKLKNITEFHYDNSRKSYRAQCKPCVYMGRKKTRAQNRPRINATRRKYHEEHPEMRLRDSLQTRVWQCLKSERNSMTLVKYLQCTHEFFLGWIIFQLYDNMTIENYGSVWNIDHCTPCASFNFNDIEDIKRCFIWKNLRPLRKEKNFTKGKKINPHEILMQELKAKVYESLT